MRTTPDLDRLQAFFDPSDIAWKPIAVSKKTGKALVAAYISNRAIMDRLDEACGPGNWRNEYREGPSGGLLCGISIRILHDDGTAEWVTKWDGAENTDVEPVKGGLSSSMRRTAVQWGIGRYLYDLPSPWVPVDERGRVLQSPPIPREFLPEHLRTTNAAPRQRRNAAPPKKTAAPSAKPPAKSSAKPPADRGVAKESAPPEKPANGRAAPSDADRYFMP